MIIRKNQKQPVLCFFNYWQIGVLDKKLGKDVKFEVENYLVSHKNIYLRLLFSSFGPLLLLMNPLRCFDVFLDFKASEIFIFHDL